MSRVADGLLYAGNGLAAVATSRTGRGSCRGEVRVLVLLALAIWFPAVALAQANLSVTGITPPAMVQVGTPGNWVIDVAGTSGPTNVTVTVIFTPQVTFNASGSTTDCVGYTAASGVPDPSTTVTCPATGATSVTINVTPLTSGAITLVAGIIADQLDSKMSDNAMYFTVGCLTPTVTAISPNAGPTTGNTNVTVTGANFEQGATLKIGGVAATNVVVVDPTTITGTTGNYTGTAGLVDVVVTNPAPCGLSGTGAKLFNYGSSTVTVTSITPNSGPITGDQIVTIKGTGFASNAVVTIGGVQANGALIMGIQFPISVPDSQTIICVTPRHGPGVVDVSVTVGSSTGTLHNGYTYTFQAPILLSISPTTGPAAGGTQVLVSGLHFLSGATVSLGGASLTNVVYTGNITGTTTAHTPGVVDVYVYNPDGQLSVLHGAFTYIGPAPTIASISPAHGSSAGGTTVTVTGTNFVTGAALLLGGTPATNLNYVSSTSIIATTSAHLAGVVDVTVTNPGNQSVTKTAAYTYDPPPTVTSVSPNNGGATELTSVTITGANFVSGTGLAVKIGGQAATSVTFVNSTTITAVAGRSTGGTVDVVVTNPDGQSGTLHNGFTYNPLPTITGALLNAGPLSGGNTVYIYGTGFMANATIKFGGVASPTVTWYGDPTQIQAVAPPNSSPVQVDIVLTNTDGQSATLAGGYKYNYAPTITSIGPRRGTQAGGDSVTITGTNFIAGTHLPNPTITIGGVAATNVVFNSSTSLTGTTGAHAPGAVDVVVTNYDGQRATLTGGYTYLGPPPTVIGITPSSGYTSGGNSVTVGGTNFVSGATFALGGIPATNVTFLSSTSLSGLAPAQAAGTVFVSVTNPDGQNGVASNGYTYVNPYPTISSISPTSGRASGGTAIAITGTGFLTNATVSLGGSAATVTSLTATQIQATTTSHTAGTVNVVVTNTDGKSATLTNGYTYNAQPTISFIAPSAGGWPAGGQPFTINGTGFMAGATVTFGGVAATGLSIQPTQITGTYPAHAAGQVTVTVTNPDTQNVSASFTYNSPPTITRVNPTSGSHLGGTVVTVVGSNFNSGTTFRVGGVNTTNRTYFGSTTIQATTGAHAVGTVDVVVINPDGQTATLTGGYTYN